MAITKPAAAAGNKKLVVDAKMFKKIDDIVAKYNEAVKLGKKASKDGLPPVEPKGLDELGALIAKSWGKVKEASGIKEAAPAKKAEPKKAAAKKTAAKKPAAKKAAAKKPAAKKPTVKKLVKAVAKKIDAKPLLNKS
ncbi:MAG TPA: hypothetical protein PLC54_03620 [Spirochaetales bacterium]|nr:hypothetical protein [Spirochaetales bacterium]